MFWGMLSTKMGHSSRSLQSCGGGQGLLDAAVCGGAHGEAGWQGSEPQTCHACESPAQLSGTQQAGAGQGWAPSFSRRSSSLEAVAVVGKGDDAGRTHAVRLGVQMPVGRPPETLCMAL